MVCVAEQREFRVDLQRHTVDEVIELSRRALSDLARVDLERAVVDRALEHLASRDEERDSIFVVDDRDRFLTVRTAFDVPDADRREIEDRLREMGLGPDRRVRFEHDPELVLGVEFRGDGTAVELERRGLPRAAVREAGRAGSWPGPGRSR